MKMRLRLRTLLVATSLVSGAAGGTLVWLLSPSVLVHKRARSTAMLQQAQDFPDGGVMIVGDSVTEFTYIPTLCGKPVFNAGLAGSQASDWKYRLPQMLEVTKPAIVIFALGRNNAKRAVTFRPEVWREDYRTLIAQAHEAKVVILGVQPAEANGLVSGSYDEALARSINGRTAALASQLDLQFIEPLSTTVGKTYDGVHLNGEGRREWVERLAAAC
jgi:GDSL-like lipase/acylhydrolase family protein